MVESAVKSVAGVVVDLTRKAPIQVLYVDDEVGFLKSARQILEMQGTFEVETALSVEEAGEKMEKETYDVIVADYVMPGKDGLEFLKELRDSGNSIPFIMFTGKGREEVAIKALNFGADRYFNKLGAPETVYGELAHGMRQSVKARGAEEALRESEEKYRSIVELAPDGILTVDLKGRVASCNTAVLRQSGYSKGEIVGRHFSRPPTTSVKDIPKYATVLKDIISGVHPKPFDFRWIYEDGTTRLGEIHISLMKKRERTVGFQAIIRDTTERKKAEERVRESEEKLRSIFESVGDGLIYLDKFGRILEANKKAVDIFGGSREEVLGKHFTKIGIFSLREIPTLMRNFARILRGKEATLNVTIKNKNGQEIPLECSASVTKADDKTMIAVVARDITERKEAERMLKASMERLKILNEKLNVVGKLTRHDVRNKLSTVINNAYLAKQRLTDDPEALEHLADIESACEQVEGIFDFARTYEKLGVEELADIDVEKSVEEATSLFSDLHGVKVTNDCQGLTVLADSLLRQLFYNLIDNSLKYGEKISQIRVHYEKGKDKAELIYEDDGVGIPKAEKEKIFEEGYGKGTGYGLYLVRKMCEVYGLTIRETGKSGKGAQFTMTISKAPTK